MNPFKIDDYVQCQGLGYAHRFKVLDVQGDYIKIRTPNNIYFYHYIQFLLATDSPQTSDAGAAEYEEAMKAAELIGEQS